MSKVTDGSYGNHGVPVGADWVVGVKVSGPNVKELLLSDLRQYTNMVQATGTDADTTMAINTLYVVDMSAWATADRTYTLPATAAVGDRIGVMVTAGDASHELILTAGSGDTLNGIAGGTEWSRVFITNEVVIMRCTVANTTWMVEYDGRIPCVASGYPNDVTTNTGGTPKVAPLANSIADNASLLDLVTNFRLGIRRSGTYIINISGRHLNNPAAQQTWQMYAYKNGASLLAIQQQNSGAAAYQSAIAKDFPLVAGDYLQLYFNAGETNKGLRGASTLTWLGVVEVL